MTVDDSLVSDSGKELLLLTTVVRGRKESDNRKLKIWVHQINTKRLTFGEHHLINDCNDQLKENYDFSI